MSTETLNKYLELFRPLIRLALKRSCKAQEIFAAIKRMLVEEATLLIESEGIDVSITKLSVLTGLQRPDIMKIREVKQDRELLATSIAARVIGQWLGDRRFSSRGKPKVLPAQGNDSDFAKLVSSVSKEVNWYAVLYDLERLKVVKRTDAGVKLISPVYLSAKNEGKGLTMLSGDLHDLVDCVIENIEHKDNTRNLHLKTHYDNIDPRSLSEIRTWCLTEGSRFIQKAQRYLSSFDRDLHPELGGSKERCSVSLAAFSVARKKSSR